tara:strand:- start:2823 stop:3131 length:309 start_codon:yes stop_codon:yes gene_type:complete
MSNKPTMSASRFQMRDEEYRISAWLSPGNLWNETKGRFEEPSPQQKATMAEIARIMHKNNMTLRCTIQQRIGEDARSFPKVAGFTMFANAPEEEEEILDDFA